MTTRRSFLASLMAAGTLPTVTWADAGHPQYLAAGLLDGAGYYLFGLGALGQEVFRVPLPERGHAAAAHPNRPEAVAFARRPGTFACVIDCLSGHQVAHLDAPSGRHFYGHGAFSRDGHYLLTTENAYETGEGRIGIWAALDGYRRIGDLASHGIGPHDILRLPSQDVFAVANGGIRTHPETGREKLNLGTMQPNLSYVDLDGRLLEQMTLDAAQRKNSIRHLAVSSDSTVAFAMQWQGTLGDERTLLGRHKSGEDPFLIGTTDLTLSRLQGYAGSVSFDDAGNRLAITSPRGGVVQIYDTASGDRMSSTLLADVCGLTQTGHGFLCSTGAGMLHCVSEIANLVHTHQVRWDNHIVKI